MGELGVGVLEHGVYFCACHLFFTNFGSISSACCHPALQVWATKLQCWDLLGGLRCFNCEKAFGQQRRGEQCHHKNGNLPGVWGLATGLWGQ